MIDDEVGLKEKPEDTRYIKRLYQNETRSTRSVGKLFYAIIGNCRLEEWAGSSLLEGAWEKIKSIPRDSTSHRIVGCIETPVQGLVTPFMPGGRG